MDYNSKELFLAFLRREEKIKNLIDEGFSITNQELDICDFTKGEFLTEICWHVANNMEGGIPLDVIHSWVRRNFTDYINNFYNNLTEDCYNN